MFPIIALSDSSVGIEREFNREHDRRELTIVNCRENMLLAKRVFTETKLANTSSCYILSLTHEMRTKESDSQKCGYRHAVASTQWQPSTPDGALLRVQRVSYTHKNPFLPYQGIIKLLL